MSSILKALKKVEDVHPEPRRTESWSHAFDSREAIRRQARRSRTVRTGLVVLCVVAVLGVGGWWLQGRGVQPGGGAADPAGKRPTESRGNEPAPPAEPRGSVRTASKPAPDRTAEPKPVARAPQPPRSTAAVPVAVKTPPPRPETRTASKPAASSRPVKASSPAPAASREPETAGSMDTSRFRLEAIVWSSNPESRFVVINGNILRLGGTMDGLTVTAIERNSVKLRSGDKAGEIRFNLD